MDATKRPIRIPPEFATYAEKHDIFELHKVYITIYYMLINIIFLYNHILII